MIPKPPAGNSQNPIPNTNCSGSFFYLNLLILLMSITKKDLEEQTKNLIDFFRTELKSESQETRKELTQLFRSELKSELNKTKHEIANHVDKGFNRQKQELTKHLSEKFESHRRQIVDEIQTFENHVIKENLTLNQEMTVNSARITRLEKTISPN